MAMESPVAPPAAGPCVYVPISHPDSPVPTYAVLQVLGISSAPDSPLRPQFAPVSVLPPNPAAAASAPRPSPSSAESAHSSSSSSDERDRDRHLVSVRPAPMKKSAAFAAPALSPAARRAAKTMLPFRPIISITHTENDTVIHAAPSDFRKVVHQLTGVASGEKGLMPTTSLAPPLPPIRGRAGGNDGEFTLRASTAQVSASQRLGTDIGDGGGGIPSASGGKPVGDATVNLLQRRKSSKVLGRLSTSCRNLPPLMPSPVTPLATDFEKIGLPATPSSSEGSLTPGIGIMAGLSPGLSPLSHGTKSMQNLSLSGGRGSHPHGSAPSPSRSHKDPSMQVKLCGDGAMDMKQPEISQLLEHQALGFHSTEDVQLANSIRLQNRKITSGLAARDADMLNLGLGPAIVAVSVPNASGGQIEEELGVREDVDAMDTETPGDGAGVHDSTPTVGGSCSADEEDSIISKKGFFFHSERPQHRDLTLLALFPESSRES